MGCYYVIPDALKEGYSGTVEWRGNLSAWIAVPTLLRQKTPRIISIPTTTTITPNALKISVGTRFANGTSFRLKSGAINVSPTPIMTNGMPALKFTATYLQLFGDRIVSATTYAAAEPIVRTQKPI